MHIDDTGKVMKQHQTIHVKVGHKVTWVRQTGAAKSWYAKFDDSPCGEGKEFGSDRTKTCTIKVGLPCQGRRRVPSVHLQQCDWRECVLADPTVVVDP